MDKKEEDRIRAIKDYDILINGTLGIVGACKIYPKLLTDDEDQYLHPLFDKNLFNALNQLGLIVGLKYLDLSNGTKNSTEAKYFARIVATTSYEILRDLNQVVGKQIRNFVTEKIGADYLKEIDSSIKRLKELKRTHEKMLKEIRHELFGHKMNNGIEQARLTSNIDVRKVYAIGRSIFDIQNNVLEQMTALIKAM
jgi:hypothetical protein